VGALMTNARSNRTGAGPGAGYNYTSTIPGSATLNYTFFATPLQTTIALGIFYKKAYVIT